MRYKPEHKAAIRRQIVTDASRRVRAEGITGAAVSAVMRDAGLTHGGFYKHFGNKNELLLESLRQAFAETADRLDSAAGKASNASPWQLIVKIYLSPAHCDHPELGCPLAALASELARIRKPMKHRVLSELADYKARLLPYMPGRRVADKERAFLTIFSTMIGAIAIARILPEPASRAKVLATTEDFLLRTFRSSPGSGRRQKRV